MRSEAPQGLRWGLLSLAAITAIIAVTEPAEARSRRRQAAPAYSPPYAAIVIDAVDLPSVMRYAPPPSPQTTLRSLRDVELQHIRAVLESVGGNKTKAAAILGIDRKSLREKLKADDEAKPKA